MKRLNRPSPAMLPYMQLRCPHLILMTTKLKCRVPEGIFSISHTWNNNYKSRKCWWTVPKSNWTDTYLAQYSQEFDVWLIYLSRCRCITPLLRALRESSLSSWLAIWWTTYVHHTNTLEMLIVGVVALLYFSCNNWSVILIYLRTPINSRNNHCMQTTKLKTLRCSHHCALRCSHHCALWCSRLV